MGERSPIRAVNPVSPSSGELRNFNSRIVGVILDERLTPWSKGSSGNKRAILRTGIRRDGVVPFAMERGTFDVAGGDLAVGHDNAAGVGQCRVHSAR